MDPQDPETELRAEIERDGADHAELPFEELAAKVLEAIDSPDKTAAETLLEVVRMAREASPERRKARGRRSSFYVPGGAVLADEPAAASPRRTATGKLKGANPKSKYAFVAGEGSSEVQKQLKNKGAGF